MMAFEQKRSASRCSRRAARAGPLDAIETERYTGCCACEADEMPLYQGVIDDCKVLP